jgi:hypothetical protein
MFLSNKIRDATAVLACYRRVAGIDAWNLANFATNPTE